MMKHTDLHTRWQGWLLLLLALFVITPFVILCFYAHPSADDWYMAAAGRDRGVIGAGLYWYAQMSGRIIQQGITSLHPIRLGITAYHFWCLGLLMGLGAAMHEAMRRWLPELGREMRLVLTAVSLMLYLWAMRSPAQAFYWVNGGNTYILAGSLQLFMLALLGYAQTHGAGVKTHLLAALIAITASWCSELAMGLQFVCLIIFAVFTWLEKKTVPRVLITLILATAVAAVVMFLSPGVPLRMGTYSNEVKSHPIPALLLSAKLTIIHLITWLTQAPFFLLSLLLLACWPAREMKTRQAWLIIGLALVMMAGTTWGGFFIGAWSMGQSIPPRAVNLLGLFFLVEWAVLLAGVAALLRAYGWARPALTPVAFLLILMAITASLRAPNNIKAAWKDLLKGDARKFDRECERRYALIQESKDEEVSVPALRTKPATLYFNDLKPDATDWRNAGMAEFYHKKAIHLTE